MAEKTKKKKLSANKSKTLILLSMALPGAIWFLLLRYLPMAGVILAFKDYKVYTKAPSFWNNMMHSKWVGLDNFKFLFSTPDSWRYVKNTIGYNVLWILLGLVVSVAFAIILNEITQKFVAKAYQTMMFFPYFLSWVVASYFVLAFLDPTRGLLTHWMSAHGMTPIQWYSEPKYWPYIWQQIRYVTLPHLRTMICILLIMNVGRIFNSDFGLFYTVPLNSGSLYSATQVIDTYVYRVMTATNNIGMSTAAGLLQNMVGFVCIISVNKIVQKIDEDSSLF